MQNRLALLSAVTAVVALSAISRGQTLYTTSFESPGFTPGPLATAPVTPGQGNWQIDHNASQVNISTSNAQTGTQSLRIDADPTAGGGGWAWYDPINLNPVALNKPIVTVDFSMFIASGTTPSGGWGMDVFASNFNFIGRMQVAGANGSVFVERALDGFVNTGAVVTKDAWHDYRLVFDFTNTIYDVLVDNVVVANDFPFTPQTGIIEDFDFRHNQQAPANDYALFDDYAISIASPVTTPTEWINPNGGSWQTAANWSPAAIPSGTSARARLGPVLTAPKSLALNAQVTLDTLEIDSAFAYTISGLPVLNSWALRFAGSTPEALVVKQGTHETLSPVLFEKDATIQIDAGATFRFRNTFDVGGRNITKTGGGTLRVRQVRAASLRIDGGIVETTGGGTSTGTSSVGTLVINGSGQLDIAAQKFIINYTGASPIAQVRNDLAANKIIDSLLLDPRQAIAFGENTVLNLASLDDVTLDATSLVLRARLRGDADMNGTVDFDDLLRLAQKYGGQGFWTDGDSDYTGSIDFSDLLSLAQNYGLTALQSGDVTLDADLHASFAADWALARSIVPEPALTAALALPALLARRRRS